MTRLHKDLVELASDPIVVRAVSEAASTLLNPEGPEFEAWLRQRYVATVAGAVAGCGSALMHEDAVLEDLVVDTSEWRVGGELTVWISEHRPGGVGVLSGILTRFQEDPRRFWRLVASVVEPGDYETVDHDLTRVVDLAVTNEELAELFGQAGPLDPNQVER